MGRRARSGALLLTLLPGLLLLAGCDDGPRGTVRDDPDRPAYRPASGDEAHPVIVRQPDGPPTVATDLVDYQGNPVSVSCSSCHSVLEPNRETRSAEQLEDFHQGLTYDHGGLSCHSCHNRDDYDQLRLADGTAVDFANVMQSCAQCHSKQKRYFDRGLHGGMAGYWDLNQGPRHRNNCIDCHDPHAPGYPTVTPVLPPDQDDWTRNLQRTLGREANLD